MKKGKWHTANNTISNRVLRLVIAIIYRWARRKGYTYVDIYMVSGDNSCTINTRVKRGIQVVTDEYQFREVIE